MNVQALCVGHASCDLTMLVEAYPAENSKAETEALLEAGGGPAANAAWLLASWGVPTAFAGAVGEDAYGRRVAEEFLAVGVDISLLDQQPGQATAVSFILVNRANGSRTIVNRKRSGPAIALGRAKLAAWAPPFLLLDGHEPAASLAAMEALPKAVTMLDAGSLREGTKLLAPRVDYLVCSERFARQATGLESLGEASARAECLRRLREINGKTVVVTLGEQGLIYDDGRQSGHLQARAVRPVDTTAAGDVFHGAMVFALLKQMPLVEALKVATTAAGLSVQSAGGRTSIPTWADVQKAMRSA
ncbi:MAG: PfkB family carbohydrate kinase [Planctomycetota bacterium]|nr:PfkB family carbohydrate kinase [Planctomycetota bacterium]